KGTSRSTRPSYRARHPKVIDSTLPSELIMGEGRSADAVACGPRPPTQWRTRPETRQEDFLVIRRSPRTWRLGNTGGRMRRVAILGAGGMGTALAVLLAKTMAEVRLWSRDREYAHQFARTRGNQRHL